MRQPVRIVLADDQYAFVEGLSMVLSAEPDLEVVALAGDGTQALQAVVAHAPDVLVVDTQMPGPDVAELVRLVGQARPATRVLLLAEDPRRPPNGQVASSAHAGTTRAVSARELAAAIRAMAAGRQPPPAMPPARPRQGRPPAPAPIPTPAGRDHHTELLLGSLSEREREILALLIRGYSNRRIAETCHLSVNTVRTHVQNVLVKLGVHSKLEAAALAVRRGLLDGDGRSWRAGGR
jgi:DNA-binding NarL/FixJ family response regulator